MNCRRVSLLTTAFALVAGLGGPQPATAAVRRGSLDATFGGTRTGIVGIKAPRHQHGHEVRRLPDGRIMIAGPASDEFEGVSAFVTVAIVHANGRVDRSFGSGGSVTIPVGGDGYATPVLAAPGNRIIVVDTHPQDGGVRLRRFLPNGGPDRTFGSNGVATYLPVAGTGLVSSPGWYRSSAAVQSDGGILVLEKTGAVFTWTGPAVYVHRLLRFRPDGTLDSGFGVNGQVLMPFTFMWPGASVTPQRVDLDRQGRILVSGLVWAGINPVRAFVARFRTTGVIDETLGVNGVLVIAAPYPWLVRVEPNEGGRIDVTFDGYDAVTVKRFTDTGAADVEFGEAGTVNVPHADLWLHDVAAIPGGGFALLAGDANCRSCGAKLLAYTRAGRADLTFGRGGVATVPMAGPSTVRTGGSWIYVGGAVVNPRTGLDLALARVRG